jgi:alpha,alpha-trehalose phosphorylase
MTGFVGLRDLGGNLGFVPRLPRALTRLALNLRARETIRLRIEVEQTRATYTLLMGERLEIHHHGEPITLTPDRPAQRPIPPAPMLEPPTQPRGRAPRRRGLPPARA